MPESGSVQVDRRALTALNALPGPEQARVLESLATLATQPADRWPEGEVQRLAAPDPLYMLKATDELRVIFRRGEHGAITILDLVLRETLERYFANRPEPQPAS
jgi:hypothetical protein